VTDPRGRKPPWEVARDREGAMGARMTIKASSGSPSAARSGSSLPESAPVVSWQLSRPPRSSAEPKDLPMAEDSPSIAGSDVRDLAQEIALRVIAMLRHQASDEAARPAREPSLHARHLG